MSSWERGYGDFELKPDLGTLRLTPWNEGTALCLGDLAWADGSPVVASPRQILRAQLDRLERARPGGVRRHRARVHRLQRHLRGRRSRRATAASSRPTTTTSTTRSSAARGSSRCCARSATTWPARAWRSRAPRASATTASTRSTSTTARRCGPPTSTRSTRPRAKEIAAAEGMAITFMAKYDQREGSSCHIHLSLRRDGAAAFAARRGAVRALRRRPARLPARADACSTRPTSTPTSASRRARSPPPRSPGGATTGRARCGSSATATRCGSSCACPAPTSTPTSRWRR